MPSTPTFATGGMGVDESPVNITFRRVRRLRHSAPLPDLAAGAVTTSASTLYWGQSFSTQAVVQNLGTTDPGPFRVRFVLVGASGDTTHGIFLGDTMVPGLAPGAATVVTQTVHPAATTARRT